MIVVSNASPLIILAKLGLFDLPQRLFGEISISQEVWDEVVIRGTGLPGSGETQQAGWIRVRQLANSAQLAAWQTKYSLGAGELSTILLAIEIQAGAALMDERRARLLAQSENVSVLGTIGVLELGYRRNEIDDLRVTYQKMLDLGAYVDHQILNRSLRNVQLAPI